MSPSCVPCLLHIFLPAVNMCCVFSLIKTSCSLTPYSGTETSLWLSSTRGELTDEQLCLPSQNSHPGSAFCLKSLLIVSLLHNDLPSRSGKIWSDTNILLKKSEVPLLSYYQVLTWCYNLALWLKLCHKQRTHNSISWHEASESLKLWFRCLSSRGKS